MPYMDRVVHKQHISTFLREFQVNVFLHIKFQIKIINSLRIHMKFLWTYFVFERIQMHRVVTRFSSDGYFHMNIFSWVHVIVSYGYSTDTFGISHAIELEGCCVMYVCGRCQVCLFYLWSTACSSRPRCTGNDSL